MSVRQYQAAQSRADSPRLTEFRLLADVTRRLLSIDDVKSPVAVAAIYDNISIWNAFAADLLLPANRLPDTLKAQLISLSLWVERHSGQVLKGAAGIGALVDVNKSVMSGLAASQGATPTPPASPGPPHRTHAA